MKIQHADSNVVKSYGLEDTSTFKIRTNSHAFRMLSSGLYSDKETAVLREIGCNAYDAHVSIGKANVPFEVKLPNKIDNQFYIRDYGPGLSDEDIRELYTTYFASTKQDSNDYTGAFGLGSKSPFSYTDSFTISSYYGGSCRIYSAHIGDQGNPQIALMSESESTETGISIGFPVKPQDFETFRRKASEVFRWFKTPPNLIGGDPLIPVEYKVDQPTWALTGDSVGRPHVLMGNVRYPLDWAKLGSLDKLQSKIVNMGNLILKFPIGKVQVAASREELQYDEASSKAMKEELTSVGKYIAQVMEASWKAIKNWGDKCKFHEDSRTLNQGLYFDEELYTLAGANDPKGLYAACSNREFLVKDIPNIEKLHIILFKSGRKGVIGSEIGAHLHLPFDRELKIVTGEASRAHQRTKQAITNSKLNQCVLLYKFKKAGGTQADVDIACKYIQAKAGDVEITDLASLDAPPKIVRVKKGQLPTLPPILNISVDKIYLPYSGGRQRRTVFNGEHNYWTWSDIEGKISALRGLVPISAPLEVAIRDVKKYKLEERTDWSIYDKHVKGVLEDKASLDKLNKELKKYTPTVMLTGWVQTSSHDILHNLVLLKERKPTLYDTIIPILKQKNVFDVIEEVHKNSKGTAVKAINTATSYLIAYKQMLQQVGSQIQHPELKEEDIGSKIPKAAQLTFDDMEKVGNLSQNAFLTMMKEYLD